MRAMTERLAVGLGVGIVVVLSGIFLVLAFLLEGGREPRVGETCCADRAGNWCLHEGTLQPYNGDGLICVRGFR